MGNKQGVEIIAISTPCFFLPIGAQITCPYLQTKASYWMIRLGCTAWDFSSSGLHVQVPGGYTRRLLEFANAGSCGVSFHAMRYSISLWLRRRFVVIEMPFRGGWDAVSLKCPLRLWFWDWISERRLWQQREGNASNKRLRASLLRLFRAENFHAIWGIEAAYPSITQWVAVLKFVNLFFFVVSLEV